MAETSKKLPTKIKVEKDLDLRDEYRAKIKISSNI